MSPLTFKSIRQLFSVRIFACLIVLQPLFINVLYAQAPDVFIIKTSGDYHFGTGEGVSEEAAKEQARKDLITSIATVISGEQSSNRQEVTQDQSSQFYQSTEVMSKTYSRLKLKNLNYLKIEADENFCKMLAYISKADFAAAVDEVKTDVREYMKQIAVRERNELSHTLIPEYYAAYLMTYFSPEPISYCAPNSTDTVQSLTTFLEAKIRTFLSKTTITVAAPFCTPNIEEQIEIPIYAAFSGNPISKCVARLNIAGNPERSLSEGKTTLFTHMFPSSRQYNYVVLLSPSAPSKEELLDLHKQVMIVEKREIAVDFSSLIKVDFNITNEGGGVFAFQPVIKNLSVAKFNWDFGDGNQSAESNPKHIYANGDNFTVTLRVNNDDNLKTSKALVTNRNTAAAPAINSTPPVTPPPTPVSPGVSPKVPTISGGANTKAAYFSEFTRGMRLDEMIKKLNQLRDNGKLVYGKKDSFLQSDKCYIILIDPATESLTAILAPGNVQRRNLLTGEEISDYKTTYKGSRSIWVDAK